MIRAVSQLLRLNDDRDFQVPPMWDAYELALNWLVVHRVPGAGISMSDGSLDSYPEVTGYTIPTLVDCGENDLAISLAHWLTSIQRPDGGFAGPEGKNESYIFDTAQVLRGLLAVAHQMPSTEIALKRAADWLMISADEDGVIRPKPDSPWSRRYGDHISEDIHLYALPPLLEVGRRFGIQRYVDCVEQSLAYYLRKPNLLEFRFLTHFYGYVLEALVDLDRPDCARKGLQDIIDSQSADGSIPAFPGAKWICSPGTAQMAIVGYKLGLVDFADATLEYLQKLQVPSGGFLGSYGFGASYAPLAEPSWACKFFLDACHWRLRATFDRQDERFRAEIDPADVRLPAVLERLGDVAGSRVLDVGCGRGQFLRALQTRYPTADLWGIDVVPKVIEDLPPGVHGRQATPLNLPYPDATFDVVLCVEVLEHTIRFRRAISEMCRVLRPGGRILIIDKDTRHLGLMPIEAWEQWFGEAEVLDLLRQFCPDGRCETLSAPVDGQTPAFLLFWHGTRSEASAGAIANIPRPTLNSTWVHRRLKTYQTAHRRATAHSIIADGFKKYQDGDAAAARRTLLSALLLDPRWGLNRGVVSIIFRSIFGTAVRKPDPPVAVEK